MHETPVSLLERLCRRPDEQHWERFVVLFTPILSRWSNRLGVPAGDTEDLLQEIFALLIRKLPEFHYDPTRSFRAWLWTVFHRQTIAWRKLQTRQLPLTVEQIEELASPDSISEATEAEYRRVLLDRIMQIVKTDFPQQTWQMFWLLTVEGQPGVEIARNFGVTPNAVYLARGRVLARLRAEMTDLDR
jgi:RNA polymerase sigma-70 factor (ECF subfamily)